ncbi:hypothetical protein [Nostoc sp.]
MSDEAIAHSSTFIHGRSLLSQVEPANNGAIARSSTFIHGRLL